MYFPVQTMEFLHLAADLFAGWCSWSLAHNLGHRWWHDDMKQGKTTFYAHGEREHHRIYDGAYRHQFAMSQDPKELFISFPLLIVGGASSLVVVLYGWTFGWGNAALFAAAFYASMIIDHRLHIVFHKRTNLPGFLAWFQKMHLLHHATHNRNYFFVTGLLWDVIFRTAVLQPERSPAPRLPFDAA